MWCNWNGWTKRIGNGAANAANRLHIVWIVSLPWTAWDHRIRLFRFVCSSSHDNWLHFSCSSLIRHPSICRSPCSNSKQHLSDMIIFISIFICTDKYKTVCRSFYFSCTSFFLAFATHSVLLPLSPRCNSTRSSSIRFVFREREK